MLGMPARATHNARMPKLLARFSAALPDTITSISYALAWTVPLLLGAAWVRALLAGIVIEFMAMHASALYGFGIARREDRLARRFLILGALTVLYLVPVTGIALAMEQAGPVLLFLWLFTGRFAYIITAKAQTAAQETARAQVLWGISLATYAVGLVLVNKLPLPPMGLDRDFRVALSISGRPDPNAQPPQLSIVFGIFYFAVQACAKFILAGWVTKPSAPRETAQIELLQSGGRQRKPRALRPRG